MEREIDEVVHAVQDGFILAVWSDRQHRWHAIETLGEDWSKGTVLWGRTLEALAKEARIFETRDSAIEAYRALVASY